MNEPLNETPFGRGAGLEVVGKHWIKIGDKEVSSKYFFLMGLFDGQIHSSFFLAPVRLPMVPTGDAVRPLPPHPAALPVHDGVGSSDVLQWPEGGASRERPPPDAGASGREPSGSCLSAIPPVLASNAVPSSSLLRAKILKKDPPSPGAPLRARGAPDAVEGRVGGPGGHVRPRGGLLRGGCGRRDGARRQPPTFAGEMNPSRIVTYIFFSLPAPQRW